MTKTFCDRCGKEIQNAKYPFENKEYYRRIVTFVPEINQHCATVTREICYACQDSLMHWWLKGGDKHGNNGEQTI